MNTVSKSLIQQGWMRALLYMLLSLVLIFSLSNVLGRIAPVAPADEGEELSMRSVMLSYATVTVVMITLAIVFTRFVDRQPLSSLGFQWKGYGKHAASGFFLGILLITTGSLILLLLQYIFFTGIVLHLTELLLSLVFFMIVALTEEIAFRGYILNNLMDSANKWVALVISSAFFSLFHAANANIGVVALLNIFVAGFLLGVNYVFTRNIWFAVLLHFSWNFFQGPVFGYEVSGLGLTSLLQQTRKGPEILTGGDFGFEGSLICLFLNLLACVFLSSYYAGYRSRTQPEFRH